MNPTQLLPFELWREIALSDPKVWYVLTRVVRGLDDPRDREIAKGIVLSTDTTKMPAYTSYSFSTRSVEDFPAKELTYTRYKLNGKLHRDRGDGPALICSDGSYYYYKHGVPHRPDEDGPAAYNAVTHITRYIVDGVNHRNHLLGPAVICPGQYERYYFFGKLHRPDHLGPAVTSIHPDGRTLHQYYRYDQFHRDPKQGPAHVTAGGSQMYFWHGKLHRDPNDGPAYTPDWVSILQGAEPVYYLDGRIVNRSGR